MLNREVRDFVRAAIAVQRETGCTVHQAKKQVMQWLGTEIPTELEFNAALNGTPARHRRGRPHGPQLSKRDAVAAVAVYFESRGVGPEAALQEARHWLGIFSSRKEAAEAVRVECDTSLKTRTVSRKVAKVAIAAYKVSTHSDQFLPQALFAYMTFKPGTTLKLPAVLSLGGARLKKS